MPEPDYRITTNHILHNTYIMQQDISSTSADVQLHSFDNGTDVREHHVVVTVGAQGRTLPYAAQLRLVTGALEQTRRRLGAKTVVKRYFLSDAANQACEIMGYELESPEYAVSIVQQAPADGTKVAVWAILMTGVATRALPSGLYEVSHGNYRHLWTASCSNHAKDSERQTRLLFNEYVMRLLSEGCTLEANCVRTWFFVNDIDNHYAGVVKARNDVFATQNLTDQTHFIASTGIGGRQADPHVLSQMDAYAVTPLQPAQMGYLYALDHLNRTSDYGVSFERGSYVDYGDRRHVYISGTASIDNKGNIVFPGDIRRQCLRMWENVEALLAEAGCTLADVSSIVCYLRDPADHEVVRRLFDERFGPSGSPQATPRLLVNAAVCRPGWLIEMECMATRQAATAFPQF